MDMEFIFFLKFQLDINKNQYVGGYYSRLCCRIVGVVGAVDRLAAGAVAAAVLSVDQRAVVVAVLSVFRETVAQ